MGGAVPGLSDLVVEAVPDPEGGSVPVRFGTTRERLEEVAEVLDSWPGEGHRYFRVRGRDGSETILRHDLASDTWRIHFFRRSTTGEPA